MILVGHDLRFLSDEGYSSYLVSGDWRDGHEMTHWSLKVSPVVSTKIFPSLSFSISNFIIWFDVWISKNSSFESCTWKKMKREISIPIPSCEDLTWQIKISELFRLRHSFRCELSLSRCYFPSCILLGVSHNGPNRFLRSTKLKIVINVIYYHFKSQYRQDINFIRTQRFLWPSLPSQPTSKDSKEEIDDKIQNLEQNNERVLRKE